LRAFRTIGVLDEMIKLGSVTDGCDIFTAHGHLVAQLPTPRCAGPDVPGSGGIMRPVLAKILADATRASGPARIAFDLQRVLRTNYLIDSYQKTYFVLDDIEQLFDSVLAADFEALFSQAHLPAYEPDARLPGDQPITSLAAAS